MTLSTEDVQAAQVADAWLEHDVGTAPGDIGRERHRSAASGSRYDSRLSLVVFGVENLVRHLQLGQVVAEQFVFGDRYRTDQDRAALPVQLGDLSSHSAKLAVFAAVDAVRHIIADHRAV